MNRFNGRWWCFKQRAASVLSPKYTKYHPCCVWNWCFLSLSETANDGEKQHFLGFASFLSGLGPHPFLPTLLGVISAQPPLVMVMEELQHQNLLGYLWKCRQVEDQWDQWLLSCTLTADSIITDSATFPEHVHMFSSRLSPMKDGSSGPSHDITEQRIFIMGRQVASAVVGWTSLCTLISSSAWIILITVYIYIYLYIYLYTSY